MSLKAVHFIFVASTLLLCFGIAAWSLVQFRGGGGTWYGGFGAGWLVAGGLMAVYARRVVRKLRGLSYV